ncbi:hypothetical protein BayCH28_03895 [Mycolicibacterium sp. CH28]|nr:hypothetical protein BayCH28_03895 [Mycolicibacterium sp. CH28]
MSQILGHRARWALRRLRKEVPGAVTAPGSHDDAEIAAMLCELGMALVEVEQPTQVVAARLMTIAKRYTLSDVRVVVLPRVLFISVGSAGSGVDASTQSTTQLNLAGRIDDIAELAEMGAITPAEAIAALREARSMKPRFSPATTVAGYAITTVGFGMISHPAWSALSAYAVLGAAVGVVLLLGRPLPSLSGILPTLAATVVTILANGFVHDTNSDDMLRIIGPALIAILPGIPLTLGAMELASSSVVAGASRLIYGVVQLMLIVFGVSLGLHIAWHTVSPHAGPTMGPWSFYVAIVVIAVGLYVHLSAPHGSLVWLIAAVAVALIGQKIGGLFLSSAHAGAIGAFLVVPFSTVASRIKSSPPAIVMMLSAFWALVPSALSFESLSEAITGGHNDIHVLSVSVAAIFSIALGTLIGWSVFHPGQRRPNAQTAPIARTADAQVHRPRWVP